MAELKLPMMYADDDPARRRFARLLQQMLGGKLPHGVIPSLEGFRAYEPAARQCIEAYMDSGPARVWGLVSPLMREEPDLGHALVNSHDAVLPARTLRLYTPDEIQALPPVTFLDRDRTIQANGITMIAGQPGAGKSLWLLGKLQEIAASVPVLLIAAEAQGGLPDRLTALSLALRQPLMPGLRICPEPVNLRDHGDLTALADAARAADARLIAIDTWAACTAGADENAVRDVGPIFAALERLKRLCNCGIVLIHHTRKDGLAYRGSSAIHGALDNLYVLTDDDGEIALRAEKTRDTIKPEPRRYRILEFETRSHPDTGQPVRAPALLPASHTLDGEDAAGPRVTGNQRKVLEALDGFESGLEAQALIDATGLSRGNLFRALHKLVKARYVRQSGFREPYLITPDGVQALC